jgi:aminoglycoside phosphotransferase family enzyme/predicted kinase
MDAAYADAAARVRQLARTLGARLIETHISWVLLLPQFAYKLKKPLRLPFLDYSTPALRRHFCEEEVRLNQRLAPSIYLGVSRVTGSLANPAFDGDGPTLDYAVRMRRFPDGSLFSERAQAGTLEAADIDRLADKLAAFHLAAPATGDAAGMAPLSRRALAALDGSSALFSEEDRGSLREWISGAAAAVDALWLTRRKAGHARECHGDLHLANLLELDGEVAAFDCVEFDPGLRCIDVVEDAAFAQMDLAAHGLPRLAARFLNAWLERTGEYEGVPGLRLCLVYRALVRATVGKLRGGEAGARYAAQALAWTRPAPPALVITHGLPGSGKTWRSHRWLEAQGGLRIRSDVERKRLFGLDALADSRARGLAIYQADATRQTYARLFALARPALQAGWPVVLDAAFLRSEEREAASQLAGSLGVAFSILDCEAPLDVLRERLAQRRGDASEADAAVLEKLRQAAEPLGPEEQARRLPEE